jgi:hypothetical protein
VCARGLICSSLHGGQISFGWLNSFYFGHECSLLPLHHDYTLWITFFYIMYKLYVPLVMLLSREVLPDFSLLSVSISFLMLFKFVGRVFGNTL